MVLVGVASYLLQVVGVRGATAATAKFTQATTAAAGAATRNMGKTTKAVGQGASAFGGLQNMLSGVKDNLLPLWAGLDLVRKAVDTILGPSQVFSDLLQTIQDVWGALIDVIIASFEPVWAPLIQMFAELVTELLPEIRPFLEGIAEVLRDVVVPIFREYRDEIKLLVAGFVVLTGLAIAAFFLAVGAAVTVVGEAVRLLKGALDAIVGAWTWFTDTAVGKEVAKMFDGIAAAVKTLVDWIWKLINGLNELKRLFPGAPTTSAPGGLAGQFDPFAQTSRGADPIGDFVKWVTEHPWWPFQRGGIAMGPTLGLLGEREPEAVIPLSTLRGGGLGGGPIYVTNYFDVRVANAAIPASEPDLVDLFERLGEMAGETNLAVIRRRA